MFWIVYVNSLKPETPTNTVIYADDTTCCTPICSENLQIKTSTKTHVSATWIRNHSQEAVDFTKRWCQSNNMLLNAEKTKVLNISVYKSITLSNELGIGTTWLERESRYCQTSRGACRQSSDLCPPHSKSRLKSKTETIWNIEIKIMWSQYCRTCSMVLYCLCQACIDICCTSMVYTTHNPIQNYVRRCPENGPKHDFT